jgi:hypothetical protein
MLVLIDSRINSSSPSGNKVSWFRQQPNSACPSFRKHDKETMFSGLLVFRNRGWENISPKIFQNNVSGKNVCEKKFPLLSDVSIFRKHG